MCNFVGVSPAHIVPFFVYKGGDKKMKYLTRNQIEKELVNRNIRTSVDAARKEGLLPRMIRKELPQGGVGSTGYYPEAMVDYLELVDVLKDDGYTYSQIRQLLTDLVVQETQVMQKKAKIQDLLENGVVESTETEIKMKMLEALRELDNMEIDERQLFERKLEMFRDNPEAKLKFLLGKDLPDKLRTWQRTE